MVHPTTPLTPRRRHTKACHAGLGQVGCQAAPPWQSVGDLPTFGSTMNRDVEFKLGGIDSCRRYASLCHLRRPCLVKRTKLFRQPSGSDEGADDDLATEPQKAALGGYDPIG